MVLDTLERIQQVLESKQRILVEFYAKWCPPCRMLGMVIEEFEEIHPDVPLYRIDVNEFKDVAIKYQALGVPVVIVLENGEVVNRHNGFLEIDDLEELYHTNE